MSGNQSNNKRIAKNTILLYIRMMLTMLISLYTSRVILQTLGVNDFGIYNVVGGIVAMFGFINGAMTSAVQRYITFAQGKGDVTEQRKVFSCSVNVQVCIAAILFILAETIGLWFLYNKMTIPIDRFDAAFWVYQCSIISSLVLIMAVPYNATIIAHERMSAFAYISISDVTMKLLIVFLLNFTPFDKLKLYAVLILMVQTSISFLYIIYCKRHFPDAKYTLQRNPGLFKEMVSFASWSLFGNMAAVAFTQGLNILLNVFFGPAVNAARAIAVQVQGAINMFSSNFQMALNPQITKTYAANDLTSMHTLIYRSCKFTYFLLFIIGLPVIIEAPLILDLWLKTVPDYTVIFLRIMILTMLVDSTANPLMVSAAATGKIKLYQSVIGGLLLLILPVSYLVLKLGCAPWSVFVVHFVICTIAFIARLFIIRPMINLSLRQYFKRAILPCIYVSVVAIILPIISYMVLSQTIASALLVIIVSVLSASFACFALGLDVNERSVIMSKVKGVYHKFVS